VLSRQSRAGKGAITQLSSPGAPGDIRGVPDPHGPGLIKQPGEAGVGPGVTRQTPGGPAGGPSALGQPGVNPNGPNVLGTPDQNQNGPQVVGQVPTVPTGPPVLRGPRGLSPGPPLMRQPPAPPNGPPVTAKPATPVEGPPVVANPPRPRETTPPPPQLDDITPYLRRLATVEDTRRRLEAALVTIVTNTTFAQALSAMTSLNEGEEQPQFPRLAVSQFEAIAQEYQALTVRFQRFTPPVPQSCRLLHANYATALSRMPGIVLTLRNAIIRRDMGAAMLVQQFANGSVDRNFAAADSELARVTRERGIPKPFDLGSGSGGGGGLIPGLP
jgi:hypothetical protein